MPRQARLDVPGALHHIMVRGIDKTDIFRDDQDRTLFLNRLGLTVSVGDNAVYAWALMRNHVHLLFRSGKSGISGTMRKLLTWYAQYFNRRHKRTGHLFENRYKSILCDEDNYLLVLVRYIHLNPLRVKVVKTIEELDRYSWTGHQTLIGRAKHPWMDVDTVLAQFAGTRKKAINEYRRFVREGAGQGTVKELTGGGLVRSQGGWSQVLSNQRRGKIEEFDQRILGGGDFVHQVLKEAEERQLRQIKHQRTGKTLQKIIEEECRKGGISRTELQGGGRRRAVSGIRSTIALRARDELGSSAAAVAREVGVSTSAITKAMAAAEKEETQGR
jgi:putative transposase